MDHGQQGALTAFATTRTVILVVEDEAILALELEQVLTEAGREVVLAAWRLTRIWYGAPSAPSVMRRFMYRIAGTKR